MGVRASAYSRCIAQAATGTPQRGSVHSVFAAAANILFPGEFVLSLNASAAPHLPNGLHLSAPAGAFPFSALRPGLPVLFGASRLHIEALACSLDLTTCPQWNPHIDHPSTLNLHTLKENGERLHKIVPYFAETGSISFGGKAVGAMPCARPRRLAPAWPAAGEHKASPLRLSPQWTQSPETTFVDIPRFARALCGRGVGLTPTGDDVLAGWMAVGWLLYGPEPEFLAACAQIMQVAREQTHLLSRCWLGYAAEGNVALPIARLLEALAREPDEENMEHTEHRKNGGNTENNAQLEQAAQAVLALGATSGYDVICGILLGLEQFLRVCALAGETVGTVPGACPRELN